MANCTDPEDERHKATVENLRTLQQRLQYVADTHDPPAVRILQDAIEAIGNQRGSLHYAGDTIGALYKELDRARDLGALREYCDRFTSTLEYLLGHTRYSDPSHDIAALLEQLDATGSGGRVLVRMIIAFARKELRPKIVDDGEHGALYPSKIPQAPTGWSWHMVDATALHPEGRETLLLQLREVDERGVSERMLAKKAPRIGFVGYSPALDLEHTDAPIHVIEICTRANHDVVDELMRVRAQGEARR